MADEINLRITRYRPDRDDKPAVQDYDVPLRNEWTILDALNHVKDEVDSTLTFRWSCRMGICGSCGMSVNGEPKLSCATFLSDYAPGPVNVEPLANFPVIRDLVINLEDFLHKMKELKTWLIPREPKPVSEGEFLQTPEQLARYKQFSMCINCMLCYAACPVYGLEPRFLGPAAIALAQRYNLDSRDGAKNERAETVSSSEGIWECTFIGECSRVCPKNVDPAGAIQRYKLTAALDWLRGVFLPRGAR